MRKPIPRRGVAALLAAASALLGVSLLSQSNVETAGATNYDQATSGDVTNCAFPNDGGCDAGVGRFRLLGAGLWRIVNVSGGPVVGA